MKNFLKHWSRKIKWLLILIFALAFSVRFYNFSNRITFWSEQARSLVVAANYLKEPTLLGQEYFRVNSFGHKLFASAIFNYSLVPLLLLSKFDPVPITGYFALLNIFTGLALYYTARKLFKEKEVAIFSLIVFLFNNYMIYHSLFIWILDYLPIFGVALIYFLYDFYKTGKMKYVFLLGLISGLAFGFEYFCLFTGFLILGYVVYQSKKRLVALLLFGIGAVVGDLPMVLFDARHDFYHVRTFFQFFIDTLHGTSGGNITYYQFLHFWPFLAVIAGYLLFLVYKRSRVLALLFLAVYLFINLKSPLISFSSAVGMPKGITVADIANASKAIASDANGNFNVAEVLDFDKRAYVLRYFVEFKYGVKPLDELSYTNLKLLYVLAGSDYDFKKSDVWEVNAGGPYKINLLSKVDSGYAIFKLGK